MDQNKNQANSITGISKELQQKEIRRFVYVMIVFTIGMALLLFLDVSAWWIWYIYFAVWTILELKIAKNIKFKWWHWALIISAIILIDWAVLELIEYIK